MEPTPSRPRLPRGYGVETATSAAGERFPWPQVERQLLGARNYWICTTCPDGRPHAKPVWGLWLEGQVLFSTHPETVTARNLARSPSVVVHLESGDEVVIVHGEGSRVTDASLLAAFGEQYERKYDWPLDAEDLDPANVSMAFYSVRPRAVLSWSGAIEIGETIARWTFA